MFITFLENMLERKICGECSISYPISETFTSHLKKLKFFHCFPGSFPRLRIFKIDVSISFTDLLQAVVKNDNMVDCFSCSAW